MGGLQKEWLIFRKQVIPPDAPDVQVREMKLAFHAGIAVMLAMTNYLANEADELVAVRILKQLHQENEAFFKEVPSVH